MSRQQPAEVVELAWRPADDARRAALLQLLFGPLQPAPPLAPAAGVGTPRQGGQRVQAGASP